MKQIKIAKQITPRYSNSIDKYLNEVGKFKILSAEEEITLINKLKSGDRAAFDLLVACNLKFVISVAKQYQNQGLALEDLINEGNIGLVKAIQFFDVTKGFKFISYAVWWIRQAILQAIIDHARVVRLPANKINLLNKIHQCQNELEQQHHHQVSPEEIAESLNMDAQAIRRHISLSHQPISMDQPLYHTNEKSTTTLYDVCHTAENILNEPDASYKESLYTDIKRFMSILTERETTVLKLHYGINEEHPMSTEEVAFKLKITNERVRQLKNNAIKKLIACKKIKYLKTYL